MDFIKKYWELICIVVLLLGLVLVWNMYSGVEEDKQEIISQYNVSKQVEQVETKQKEIDNREEKVYPAIDKQLKDLKNKKKAVKERVEDEIKKSNINDISHKFTQLGYSSCVIRR